MRLSEHVYRTISSIAGPLLFVQGVFSAQIGEVVRVIAPDGRSMDAEVLEIEGDTVLIEVFGETRGLDIGNTSIAFSDSIRKIPLSPDIIGRIFSGAFLPADNMPMFVAEKWSAITGAAMNPAARARPEEFIETGFSVIDGLNTLVKGQKLPVFSCSGLPSRELVSGVLKNARLSAGSAEFVVVFAALGLSFHEYSYYMAVLEEMQTGFVAFINSADEPVMERLLAPRFALTTAEYLAFEMGMDVLVIITDMTNYCDALREISTAREELPGRRGYPGYMYSDLASLYERAGRIKGLKGSVTLLPVVTMPEDDITHPIPDLTGYITEGQVVLSRELHRLNIFPPVDVLPSLSRLMQKGIGKGRTREDHRRTANNLYKYYARGRDLRRLATIVGREGMPDKDIRLLDFAERFEQEFVGHGNSRRTIAETLDKGISLMQQFGLELT
ncbi:MAG: V-type ATP synthase subunit B [Thermodesulfovibrio sp.]|nr:V-type ATP synthase subunit B [Thermodesulfovibrio sp.]